jgi:hypothetical protein
MKEDSRLAAQGGTSAHQTSLTSCLMTGLELEEQQYVSYNIDLIQLIII